MGGDTMTAPREEYGEVLKSKAPEPEDCPMWKLALIAMPQLGVQVLWIFLGPNSAPYMKHLGMGSALATLNNMAGPITGFFTGPLVGALSDHCTSRLGRRRPVILFGLCSFCIAGTIFSGAEHVLGENAIYVAAPMFWCLDVTINILQTPHRALAADFASEKQQVPTQVMFVFIGAVGSFLGFSVMEIYDVPVDHMFELFFGIFLLNALLVGIQFVVAKEIPLQKDLNAPKKSICAPITDCVEAVKASPPLVYHLASIQALVWIGVTAWGGYAGQWFANSVYQGDQNAALHSLKRDRYAEGMQAFAEGGQIQSIVQLPVTLAIIFIMMRTSIRPRLIYAPLIFVGAVVSFLAAFAVGHDGDFAEFCMVLAGLPPTGSFAIPFGLIAALNKRMEKEGKVVSTALQMALLNCCVTVGQQVCTMALATIEGVMPLEKALPFVFMLAGGAMTIAGISTLFLDDRSAEDNTTIDSETSGEEASSEESGQSSSDE